MILISNNQTAKVLKPGEKTLHFITPTVSPQLASVLGRGLFSIASMGRDHFDSGRRHLFIQRVAVVRLVADQPLRELLDEAFEESVRDRETSCGEADVV